MVFTDPYGIWVFLRAKPICRMGFFLIFTNLWKKSKKIKVQKSFIKPWFKKWSIYHNLV